MTSCLHLLCTTHRRAAYGLAWVDLCASSWVRVGALPCLQASTTAHDMSVHYQASSSAAMVAPWLARASVVAVGPGLGDDPWVTGTAVEVMRRARARGVPLVVDGSALSHIVAQVRQAAHAGGQAGRDAFQRMGE